MQDRSVPPPSPCSEVWKIQNASLKEAVNTVLSVRFLGNLTENVRFLAVFSHVVLRALAQV